MELQTNSTNKKYIYCNQKVALDVINKGYNVFLTGPAGSGKSYLIKKYYEHCLLENKKIAITAMTGSAAYLINGKTLHSWAGIKLGEGTKEELYELVLNKDIYYLNWVTTQVLVIDEISMLTKELFDKLDFIGKKVRNNEAPFGGIQLILSGDFCQLPPITDKKNNFCFMSQEWNNIVNYNLFLDCIYRQEDESFQNMLNKIRIGLVDDNIISLLEKCSKKLIDPDALIQPTKLFPYKKDVENINKKHLLKLGNEVIRKKVEYIIEKIDSKWSSNETNYIINQMNKNSSYQQLLELAIGAQVMLIINLNPEKGLINGSRGIIVGFEEKTNYPVVQFLSGLQKVIEPYEWEHIDKKGIIKVKQIPLLLSWAMSIHKAQGLSLDCVKIDIGKKIFEFGQTYVALSRVRKLCLEPENGINEGLYIVSYSSDKIKCHPQVLNFYNQFNFLS